MTEPFYTDDHDAFRTIVREWVVREVEPNVQRWDDQHNIDPEAWLSAGRQGVLGLTIPAEYDGSGTNDFRYRCVVIEELARVGAASLASGFSLNEDIVAAYLADLGTEEQKKAWLPRMAAGEVIGAIAMTEPSTGSDLRAIRTTAVRDGDDWIINGSKTFITNGINAKLVIVVARTGEVDGRAAFGLFLVETGTPGFSRGRQLQKIGMQAQDTAELFFDNVRIPATNLLGKEGEGFFALTDHLPLERLSLSYYGYAASEAAIEWTLEYTSSRTAFGTRVLDFQNSRFVLAQLATEVEVTRSYLREQVLRLNEGTMDAVDGAKCKLWATQVQMRVMDACLQLHGGYGYMSEYPIARAFADARVQPIYGGTNEIMKEIIGRSLSARTKK